MTATNFFTEQYATAEWANKIAGGFQKLLGAVIDDVEPDRLAGHVICDERHHQPFGLVHGGVWTALVEGFASMAAGYDAARSGNVVVGVSNQTDFLRAHRTGRVDVVATPIHRGRLQQLWEVHITRPDDGKMIARGQVRVQVLPSDREVAGMSADEAMERD